MRHFFGRGLWATALAAAVLALAGFANAAEIDPSSPGSLSTLAVPQASPAGRPPIDLPEDLPAVEFEPEGGFEPDPLFDEDFDIANPIEAQDPLEPMNRVVFDFNQTLDTLVFDPITQTYQFIFPEVARQGINRAFRNANAPSTLVNDLLQLRFVDAGQTVGRFVLNTTVGAAGLFDAGIEAGWEHHSSDFGQTLAVWGAPSGPYLMLPLFGPSTIRNGFGDLVDRLFQPLTYLLGTPTQLFIGTTNGLALRDENIDQLNALKDSSVDFYSVLRSAYFQNREAEIWEHLEEPIPAVVEAQLK